MKQYPIKKLEQVYDRFLRELRKGNQETRGTYERSLREFFRYLHGKKGVVLDRNEVELYKKYLFQKRHLAPVSVSTYLTALRRFFRYMQYLRLLDSNPAANVRGSKRPSTHSRETLLPDQVQAVLQSIERIDERGFRDFAIVKAMIGCGLTEIELIRANISDLRQVSSRMVLYVQGKGKTTKETGVILPSDVKDAFLGYLAFRREASSEEPLFMSAGNRTRGKRMTPRGIRERVNMYLESAGVKSGKHHRITPFSLRHSAAAQMAENGASIEEVQSRFRIGTPGTAMIYFRQSGKSQPET
jgi:site-specific recombinase XerD